MPNQSNDSTPSTPDPLSALELDGAKRSNWNDVVLCVFTSISEMLMNCGFRVEQNAISTDTTPQYGTMALMSFALSTKDDRRRLCDLEADDDEVAGAAAGFVYSILRMRGGTTVQRKILGVAIVRCFLAAAGINLVLSNSVRYACEAMDAEEDVRRTLSSPLSTQPRVDAIFLAYLAGRAAKSGWMGERGRTVLALPAFWSPAP